MSLILPGSPNFSLHESNLSATPSTTAPGTNISHYASGPHVKNPTFTQLIASTSFDAILVIVQIGNNSVSNGDSSTLLDIAIGAASSETVIIPDLMAGWANSHSGGGPRSYIFPLYIPAGSRISARTQSIRTSGTVNVVVQLWGGPSNPDRWWAGHEVTAYGADLTNSAGTKLTPGTFGTEGTGVSLGTLSRHTRALALGVQGHPDDTSWSSLAYHFDIGIDSSSTEWFSTDQFHSFSATVETISQVVPWWPVFQPLPSGTEIMVRAESSGASPDALSAAVYGVS